MFIFSGVVKFMLFYLLFVIGFKGGVSFVVYGIFVDILWVIVVGIVLLFLIFFVVFVLFKVMI